MNAEILLRILDGLREFLPLVIFLVVVPVALYLSYRGRQKQARDLKALAGKLGLQFRGEPQPEALGQAYRRVEQSGFLKSLLAMAQPLSIGGKYNGYRVEIKLLRQNKRNLTEAAALFDEPLGLGLRISKAGFWNRNLTMGKAARVESGNAELDKAAAIQARDELRARYIARSVQAQQALLALFRRRGTEITDQGATLRQDGHQTDYGKIKGVLDDMTRAMQAVAAAVGQGHKTDEYQ